MPVSFPHPHGPDAFSYCLCACCLCVSQPATVAASLVRLVCPDCEQRVCIADIEDAPDEFLDPIMSEVMRDPGTQGEFNVLFSFLWRCRIGRRVRPGYLCAL